jgi:hypothetical protein
MKETTADRASSTALVQTLSGSILLLNHPKRTTTDAEGTAIEGGDYLWRLRVLVRLSAPSHTSLLIMTRSSAAAEVRKNDPGTMALTNDKRRQQIWHSVRKYIYA